MEPPALMRLTVRVKPGSKREGVERVSETEYIVRVRARPVEGKANDAVVAALAGHFGVARSRISIARGSAGRTKIIDIG